LPARSDRLGVTKQTAQGQGGVRVRHGGLRTPQHGVHGAAGDVGGGHTVQGVRRFYLGGGKARRGCHGDRRDGHEAERRVFDGGATTSDVQNVYRDVHRPSVELSRRRLQDRGGAAVEGLRESLRRQREAVGGGDAEVPRGGRTGGRGKSHEEDDVGPVLVGPPALLQVSVHSGEGAPRGRRGPRGHQMRQVRRDRVAEHGGGADFGAAGARRRGAYGFRLDG
jgi:hypothetical protein